MSESPQSQHVSRYNSSSVSVIGEGTVYRGDIEFEGVLHINGDFHGNVKGDGDLGIGLTGRVCSVIHAGNVIISGLVWGKVFAQGRVAIKSSAIVIGDIQASTLVVEEGSILHGKLEILNHREQRKVVKPGLYSYRKIGAEQEQLPATPDSWEQDATGENGDDESGSKPSGKKYSVWN